MRRNNANGPVEKSETGTPTAEHRKAGRDGRIALYIALAFPVISIVSLLGGFSAVASISGGLCVALVMVGLPAEPSSIEAFSLIAGRKSLSGSAIGGIRETQEMLDYCAERGIVCDIEKIAIDKINDAYERMLKSDVKYRFVIDLASLA